MLVRFSTFAALLLLSGLTACNSQKKAATPKPVPVNVAKVVQETVPLDIPVIGSAEALATVQLKARVLGQITEVHFQEGALVQKGDLLFSIDPRPFDVAIDRARANLAAADVNAANAESQFQRYSGLTGQGAASKEQLAQYRTTADSLKSDLQAKKADLDEALLSREWTEVRAPITGRIGAALYKEGNIVQANADTLAVINQIQPIHVTFSLPENDLASVREASQKGTLAVLVRNPSTNRELGRGTLDFIDNTVDRTTGTVGLKARLANEQETLWPGQFVDLALRVAEEKDVLVIPSTAIMDSQDGAKVLVVNDRKTTLRKVEVSRNFGNQSVIRSGLKPGEMVVTSGQFRVTPGAPVEVREETNQSEKPAIATTPVSETSS